MSYESCDSKEFLINRQMGLYVKWVASSFLFISSEGCNANKGKV